MIKLVLYISVNELNELANVTRILGAYSPFSGTPSTVGSSDSCWPFHLSKQFEGRVSGKILGIRIFNKLQVCRSDFLVLTYNNRAFTMNNFLNYKTYL